MGRPHRVQKPNLIYHVYSRCINRMNLMKLDKIKDMLIKVIAETQKKYLFELNDFEILDNHFHFKIKTVKNGTEISKIMQRIKSVFAKRYNKLMNRTGPFWNERYASKIIEIIAEKAKDILTLLFYLFFNAVRKGIVKNPGDYKYSAFNCYVDKNYKCPLKITLSDAFLALGDTFEERSRIFLQYVREFKNKIGARD